MRKVQTISGLFVLAMFLILGLLAGLISPYELGVKILPEQLRPPSMAHWFGQNHHGEDLMTIVFYGTRVSLLVGFATVIVSMVVGTTLGLVAGYQGGWIDHVISRVIDIVLAFPGILLAIAISAVLGPSLFNIVIALVAGGWVSFARLVRGQVLSLREREYVSASRALGASGYRIVFRHLLPNLWPPLVVQSSFAMAAAILAESSLSFLGLGVPPETPSWGMAVSDGARYLLEAPHIALFPGMAIVFTVLALNLLGDGLRDYVQEH